MISFIRLFLLSLFPCLLFAQVADQDKALGSSDEPLPFLNADFFADSLAEAYTLEEDPMGAQRLLQVRNSNIVPSVFLSSDILYSDNHLKVSKQQLNTNKANGDITDALTLNLSLNFNLGLGEYGLGDEVVVAPSFSFINSRSFTDPLHDYGKIYSKDRAMNMDTLMVQFSLPFVLPDDWILNFNHTYASPYYYLGKKEQLMYSNVPSFSFTKNFPLDNGDTISFVGGVNYTFSDAPDFQSTFEDSGLAELGVSFEFYKMLTAQKLGGDPVAGNPSDAGDSLSNSYTLSYIKPFGERVIMTPSYNFTSQNYTRGKNRSRTTKLHSLSVLCSFSIYEWFSISGLSSYSKSSTSGTTEDADLKYKDFTNAITLSVNHSF
jgi:hypothetical protein